MTVRPAQASDIEALAAVLEGTELFPPEMLPQMMAGFLSGEGEELWLTIMRDDLPVGFCYAMPEALTEGTWNMLALAVLPDCQGEGCGKKMVRHLEATLKSQGCRILIVDTSGTDAFAGTRAFYEAAGYLEEARIRDYWAPGDDKVIFRKALL